MPIDYNKYPPNWKTEIRPAILKRAQNHCEFCHVPNYAVGYRLGNGDFERVSGNEYCDLLGWGDLGYKEAQKAAKYYTEMHDIKHIVIVLTIAHLDHDITNNDYSNLKALCQKCHLNYDKEYHKENRIKTLKRKRS